MAKKLWGGRFAKKTHPLVEEFTRSVQYDHKLAKYDIFGSMIHVQVLKRAGYLTSAESAKLTRALGGLYKDAAAGKFKYDPSAEDIHSDVQNKLKSRVGDLVLKLHTARSRNEQVAFATKAYCKTEVAKLLADINKLSSALKTLAGSYKDLVIPGFTHMQHAQPVYLKDHLMAYVDMLGRDAKRFKAASDGIEMTMGAGSLAGTPVAAGKYSISVPGFKLKAVSNPIDAVSDRDFVLDILSAVAITGTHLSRLAEDLVIWSSKEFSFVEADDSFCTGSSLMPQKKNPDVLELVRGNSGRFYGNLVSVLVTMKGLPLSYNRDMQLDKEPLFSSIETVSSQIRVLAALVKTLKFNKASIEQFLEDESLYATDLVYYLVERGVPFATAHSIVGKLIRHSIESGIEIKTMTDKELGKFSEKLSWSQILRLFNPKVSAASKRSVKR